MPRKFKRYPDGAKLVLLGSVWNQMCDAVEWLLGIGVAQGGTLEMLQTPGGPKFAVRGKTSDRSRTVTIVEPYTVGGTNNGYYVGNSHSTGGDYFKNCLVRDPNQGYVGSPVYLPLQGVIANGRWEGEMADVSFGDGYPETQNVEIIVIDSPSIVRFRVKSGKFQGSHRALLSGEAEDDALWRDLLNVDPKCG